MNGIHPKSTSKTSIRPASWSFLFYHFLHETPQKVKIIIITDCGTHRSTLTNLFQNIYKHTDVEKIHSFQPSIFQPTRMRILSILASMCLIVGNASAFLSTTHGIRSAIGTSSNRSNQRHAVDTSSESDILDSIEVGNARLSSYFSFPLDDWQLQAGGDICKGRNVIVCAPTGAGKTVVGEMAIHIACENGSSSIYTTPLKALSNQKFVELRQIFGKGAVGLSTGDMSINRGAQVSVMTTEVYRNMAWRSSSIQEGQLVRDDELASNAVVVLDEFHYMGQPGRGGVWEECVITSPAHTQLVGLSATLPNALELAQWMESVTGRTTVLVEARGGRPVPLRYLFATKKGLYPLFKDPDAGPGSPKGMLGYRGDGIAPPGNSAKKNGFGSINGGSDKEELPKGLQINPVLNAATEKRTQTINDAINRIKRQDGSSDANNNRQSIERERWFKKGPMSARDEVRERDRLLKRELRKAVPSLAILLQRLKQKKLLPAILFIFSRAGCDEAATTVCQQMKGARDTNLNLDDDLETEYSEKAQSTGGRSRRPTRKRSERFQERLVNDAQGRTFRRSSNYVDDDTLSSVFDDTFRGIDVEFDDSSPLSSKNWEFYGIAGLLSLDEVKQVANRVSAFNEANIEIAFDEATIEEFLFGVGSHHAGMLAAHKAFVEKLYRDQLMKVVFATETLAAGINMPARTTCICAMAKRGESSSMKLLETSNLLQMAGRAGRRGMDTDGTCVLVATPFEGHEEAALILTSEIKPIQSQFSPSYTLAVNLLARGTGKLEIAQQLIQKSFAMWQKRQIEESLEQQGEEVIEVLEAVSHGQFMKVVADSLLEKIEQRNSNFDISTLQLLVDIFDDRKLLRKTSKSYIGLAEQLAIQRQIMTYLQHEKDSSLARTDDEIFKDVPNQDKSDIESQIEAQKQRISSVEREVSKHPFSRIAAFVNEVTKEKSSSSQLMADILDASRNGLNPRPEKGSPLIPDELTVFAKSFITMKKKRKSLLNSVGDDDLIDKASEIGLRRDSTWRDMLSLTKVLVAYGCLTTTKWDLSDDDDVLEAETFEITAAGTNIGMLAFDNTLWALVGMGGAWDVVGASAQLDLFRQRMKAFESSSDDWDEYGDDFNFPSTHSEAIEISSNDVPIAQVEAETLIDRLRDMTPFELAGYVACLVSEGNRRNGPSSVTESFQRFTPAQQRAIQASLSTAERLVEVQKQCGVEDSQSRCELELSTCEVVTAWARGCSWSDALLISGAAPGDLARMLGRVLDALRQFSKLQFTPVRATNGQKMALSPGIHPEVRRLCLEAAKGINRYPVKDPLPFDADDDDDISDNLGPEGGDEENNTDGKTSQIITTNG